MKSDAWISDTGEGDRDYYLHARLTKQLMPLVNSGKPGNPPVRGQHLQRMVEEVDYAGDASRCCRFLSQQVQDMKVSPVDAIKYTHGEVHSPGRPSFRQFIFQSLHVYWDTLTCTSALRTSMTCRISFPKFSKVSD